MTTVSKRLRILENAMSAVARRLLRVWACEVEFELATRREKFSIHSTTVWGMMVAYHDLLVIDLLSLLDATAARNGFLGKLTSDEHMQLALPPQPNTTDESELAELVWESKQAAFYRLFPTRERVGDTCPSKQDFRDLRDKLNSGARTLKDARDARAHRYTDPREPVRGLAAQNTLDVAKSIRQVLADIRLLLSDESFYVPVLERPSGDVAARDLVDLVLTGTLEHTIQRWEHAAAKEASNAEFLWQKRAAYYSKLHASHGTRSDEDERLFND